MKGPILSGFRRRPVITGLHSRSTLLRQQKRRPAYGTMPTHRPGNTAPKRRPRARSRHACWQAVRAAACRSGPEQQPNVAALSLAWLRAAHSCCQPHQGRHIAGHVQGGQAFGQQVPGLVGAPRTRENVAHRPSRPMLTNATFPVRRAP